MFTAPSIPSETGKALRPEAFLRRFLATRQRTVEICQPLETEDYVVQTCYEASPPKWHLAHTTWFWEQFLLVPHLPGYQVFHPAFGKLFNSYYQSAGEILHKDFRGTFSRPTVREVMAYRHHVEAGMERFLHKASEQKLAALGTVLEMGILHEEQHQELLIADIKHILGSNPLFPAYRTDLNTPPPATLIPLEWVAFAGGVVEIGHQEDGFCIDIEQPVHQVLLRPFALANQLVTCGEYLEFIEAGGYENPRFWLSDGWSTVRAQGWKAPLYWQNLEGSWQIFTLGGLRPLEPQEPVCHLSFYEAQAYATFRDVRLPTEAEWEHAARTLSAHADFGPYNNLESDYLHPVPASTHPAATPVAQLFGDVWEWTQTPYLPYPGYRFENTGLGEYNGKFMANQLVMRGGCFGTPRQHLRLSYRNFYYPHNRWQAGGIRLAQDA